MEALALTHLLLAGLLANLPFAPQAWRPATRAGAWAGAYTVWMGIALLALLGDGQAPTAWELWPVTAALFSVLAFPGITWRYLRP